LLQEDVAYGVIYEVADGLARVNHKSIGEFHALRTSGTQFSRNDDFTPLGTALHHEAENTIACAADGETTEELVSEGFALSDSRKAAILNLLGVQLERVFGESESFLYERRQFANTTSLLTKNLLCVRGTDDDLRECGRAN
jgi:hypothetical protein